MDITVHNKDVIVIPLPEIVHGDDKEHHEWRFHHWYNPHTAVIAVDIELTMVPASPV